MTLPTDNSTPRYVIQHHSGHGADHCDLMLQRGDVLWTWQLDEPLSPQAGAMPARRIGDHRLAHLDYEGPISRGRGQCRIVDRGRLSWLELGDERIVVALRDGSSAGRYELVLADATAGLWRIRPVQATPGTPGSASR